MISINTVYERVLAILNKENRGYLTADEFNSFANQAQLEIFEQYFFDLNQFKRRNTDDGEFSDLVKLTEEKISIFNEYATGLTSVPVDLHKVGTIIVNGIEAEKVSRAEFARYQNSPLILSNSDYPVYIQNAGAVTIYPDAAFDISYVRKPAPVQWGYNAVGLYDVTTTSNFELHESEETNLVFKILGYAGLSLQNGEVYQVAEAKDTKKITQEKS
jgi:hypothetical protein